MQQVYQDQVYQDKFKTLHNIKGYGTRTENTTESDAKRRNQKKKPT